jgi:hypothetical protein
MSKQGTGCEVGGYTCAGLCPSHDGGAMKIVFKFEFGVILGIFPSQIC